MTLPYLEQLWGSWFLSPNLGPNMAPPACGGLGVPRRGLCPRCPTSLCKTLTYPPFRTLGPLVHRPHFILIIPSFVLSLQTWGQRASAAPSVHSSSVIPVMALTCLPRREGTPWLNNVRRTWRPFRWLSEAIGEGWIQAWSQANTKTPFSYQVQGCQER